MVKLLIGISSFVSLFATLWYEDNNREAVLTAIVQEVLLAYLLAFFCVMLRPCQQTCVLLEAAPSPVPAAKVDFSDLLPADVLQYVDGVYQCPAVCGHLF